MYIVDGGMSARTAATFFGLSFRAVQRFAIWLDHGDRAVNRTETPGRFACKRCLRVLPIAAFAADASNAAGHRYTCKVCYNAARKARTAPATTEDLDLQLAEHEAAFGYWVVMDQYFFESDWFGTERWRS